MGQRFDRRPRSDEPVGHRLLGIIMLALAVGLLGALVFVFGLEVPSLRGTAEVLGLSEAAGVEVPSRQATPQNSAAARGQAAGPTQTTPHPTSAASVVSVAESSPSAPSCAPGPTPSFLADLAELKRQLGATMGEPRECARRDPDSGDILQRTTTGLAAYRTHTEEPTFTDGWRRWALTPRGLVSWEGQDDRPAEPPADVAAQPTRTPTARPTPVGNQRMRVANTDGRGLVLRTEPRQGARVPRGLLEGTLVTVLEREGDTWVRVRADNGQEGWVPPQYLAPAD